MTEFYKFKIFNQAAQSNQVLNITYNTKNTGTELNNMPTVPWLKNEIFEFFFMVKKMKVIEEI